MALQLGDTAPNFTADTTDGPLSLHEYVDSVESHEGWSADIADVSGSGLNFPLVGDEDRTVA